MKLKMGNVENMEGDLEIKMMSNLTKAAAHCIQLQCGREYGFPADPKEELRATDLTKIPDKELEFAPTNNLVTERKLSVFSRRSVTAKCKNSKHTGELLERQHGPSQCRNKKFAQPSHPHPQRTCSNEC